MATANKIRVMIVGPRPPEARAFDEFLQKQTDITLVGECTDLKMVPTTAWKCVPHVILVYLRGKQFAMGAARQILSELPEVRLLMVVPACGNMNATEIIENGACGVLTWNDSYRQGARAIRSVAMGEIWGSRMVLSRIVHTAIRTTMRNQTVSQSMNTLTGREGEIVHLLKAGSSNKEIAAQLAISDKTVKTHLHNIFGKLKVNRRSKIFPNLFS